MCVVFITSTNQLPLLYDYIKQNLPRDQPHPELTEERTQIKVESASQLNHFSITLLVVCSIVDCLGKLWTYFFCIRQGQLENVTTVVAGIAIVLLQMPLFLDLSKVLLQRADEAGSLVGQEMSRIEEKYKVRLLWHYWCLDKGEKVFTVKGEPASDEEC